MPRSLLAIALLSTVLLASCGNDLQGRFSGSPTKAAPQIEFLSMEFNDEGEVVATFRAASANIEPQNYEISIVTDGGEILDSGQFELTPGQRVQLETESLPEGTYNLKACSQLLSGATAMQALDCSDGYSLSGWGT